MSKKTDDRLFWTRTRAATHTAIHTAARTLQYTLQHTLQYTLQHALLLTLRHLLQLYRDVGEALRQAVLDKNVALVRELASLDAQQRLNQQSDEGTSCHM